MDKLAQMQAFVAVVTETSFVRAAAKLNLSAQLVSKYVSALETALGVLGRLSLGWTLATNSRACPERPTQRDVLLGERFLR